MQLVQSLETNKCFLNSNHREAAKLYEGVACVCIY